MSAEPEIVVVTVERQPGGRYYAAIGWLRAGGRAGGLRLIAGTFRDSAHAARRMGRLHLVCGDHLPRGPD